VSTAAELFLDSFLIEGAELLRYVATTQSGSACQSRPNLVGESPAALAPLFARGLAVCRSFVAAFGRFSGIARSHAR
jgi:hypothetical protein